MSFDLRTREINSFGQNGATETESDFSIGFTVHGKGVGH